MVVKSTDPLYPLNYQILVSFRVHLAPDLQSPGPEVHMAQGMDVCVLCRLLARLLALVRHLVAEDWTVMLQLLDGTARTLSEEAEEVMAGGDLLLGEILTDQGPSPDLVLHLSGGTVLPDGDRLATKEEEQGHAVSRAEVEVHIQCGPVDPAVGRGLADQGPAHPVHTPLEVVPGVDHDQLLIKGEVEVVVVVVASLAVAAVMISETAGREVNLLGIETPSPNGFAILNLGTNSFM